MKAGGRLCRVTPSPSPFNFGGIPAEVNMHHRWSAVKRVDSGAAFLVSLHSLLQSEHLTGMKNWLLSLLRERTFHLKPSTLQGSTYISAKWKHRQDDSWRNFFFCFCFHVSVGWHHLCWFLSLKPSPPHDPLQIKDCFVTVFSKGDILRSAFPFTQRWGVTAECLCSYSSGKLLLTSTRNLGYFSLIYYFF